MQKVILKDKVYVEGPQCPQDNSFLHPNVPVYSEDLSKYIKIWKPEETFGTQQSSDNMEVDNVAATSVVPTTCYTNTL